MAGRPGSGPPGGEAAAVADADTRQHRLTAAEFRSLYERLRDGTAWGRDDRRGALNNMQPALLAAAAREVQTGRTVSLAAPIEGTPSADNPDPLVDRITPPVAGRPDASGLDFALDTLSLHVHGNADSHLDALCHVVYDGTLYNDVPAANWTAEGAGQLSIAVADQGIAGRAVLLDIPRVRGIEWLEPGDHVTAGDLASAEAAQGVRVEAGDILLVRVGHRRRRAVLGPWDAASARAGLHPAAMELVAERRVAVLGSDSNNDTAPSAAEGVDFPVHVLALRALGLMLLDYLQFEDLAATCEAAGRWSFLCVIAPLRLPLGTGSPVNPIAIF
jgi:kynurenine formamidase